MTEERWLSVVGYEGVYGHPYDDLNTCASVRPDRRRACRVCMRRHGQEKRLRAKERLAA